jgi:hypothetical protein
MIAPALGDFQATSPLNQLDAFANQQAEQARNLVETCEAS